MMDKAFEATGVVHRMLDALRHSFASNLYARFVEMKIISKLLAEMLAWRSPTTATSIFFEGDSTTPSGRRLEREREAKRTGSCTGSMLCIVLCAACGSELSHTIPGSNIFCRKVHAHPGAARCSMRLRLAAITIFRTGYHSSLRASLFVEEALGEVEAEGLRHVLEILHGGGLALGADGRAP